MVFAYRAALAMAMVVAPWGSIGHYLLLSLRFRPDCGVRPPRLPCSVRRVVSLLRLSIRTGKPQPALREDSMNSGTFTAVADSGAITMDVHQQQWPWFAVMVKGSREKHA